MQLTKSGLEKLLRAAEEAHVEHEKTLGHRDQDWPAWYAEFIIKELEENHE